MNAPQPLPVMIPLSKIVKGDNPRRYFDRTKHDEMVASIRLRGVLQAILVRPKGDQFSIVLGERRWRASQEAYGPDGAIPATVREMTDEEALLAAIDENEIRDDTSETEQADAAVRVLAACHNDRAEAARRLGWSQGKLARRLALANLSDPVKLALDERRIKIGHAELLAAVPLDKQEKGLETILSAGLDVNKTRELLMRVTQNLASTCFDKSECTTCAFNSGTQRVLFETHVEDGHCTNPTCYELKVQAVEQARHAEQERAADAAGAAPTPVLDAADERYGPFGETSSLSGPQHRSEELHSPSDSSETRAPAQQISAATTHKPATTVQSIASRTTDLREAVWRTALARALAGNAAHGQVAILVAAMSGTLSQIKADTLTSRASLLVGSSFPDLDYKGKVDAIRSLSDRQAANVLSVIGAAYAKDVVSFGHVADLARTFEIDLRETWKVDQSFLERFTKDELKFIAQECGLIAHMGEKAFARLLGSKKADLIVAMLNRPGFDWAGRLPSAMTLDAKYGPPHPPVAPQIDVVMPNIAA